MFLILPLLRFRAPYLLDDVVQCNRKETGGATEWVDHEISRSRVEHLNGHAANVARCEELSAVATKVRPYNFLVRLTLHVDVGVQHVVRLKLRDDVSENSRFQLDNFVGLENRGGTLAHPGEDRVESFLDLQLAVEALAFLCGCVELYLRSAFVSDLAEDYLEQFPERFGLLQALIRRYVIVAAAERKEKSIALCWRQRTERWAFRVLWRFALDWYIVNFGELDTPSGALDLPIAEPVLAVGPQPKLSVY